MIAIPIKDSFAYIESHQITSILPFELWKENHLQSMRDKGQMSCGQCKNVKSINGKCPHCQDNWETARHVEKIDFNERYFEKLYGIENKTLNSGIDL